MQNVVSRTTRKRKMALFPATATLAFWQMRQVWKLFALVTLGMIAAVVLVGATPLFAKVNATASMRAAFANSGSDPSSYAQATIEVLDPTAIKQTIQKFEHDYRQQGGPFFTIPPAISIHLAFTQVYQSDGLTPVPNQLLAVHGYDMDHIASHIHLLQGKLPQTTPTTANNVLQIALTKANATALGAHIGSTYTITASHFVIPPTTGISISTLFTVTLQVVGILQDTNQTAFEEPFWHGDDLGQHPAVAMISPAYDNVIASNTGLLSFFHRLSLGDDQHVFLGFPAGASLSAFFSLNIRAINSDTISQLQPRLDYLTSQEPSNFTGFFVDKISVDNTNINLINALNANTATVVQVPVLTLLGLMVGLILFFITLMTELLITREAESIAVMRSRGATSRQIFLVFVVQSLLLGLLTVLIAPLLIPLVVRVMIIALFPSIIQSALDVLPATPWGTLLALGWYIWVAVLLVILTMCLAVWRTLRNSTLGRSTTQTTGVQRPLWQRFSVDLFVALLGVLTYGLYTYLSSTGIIDAELQIVLAAPCMLVAATLLCLAALLLVLRLFPLLLQRGAALAARGTGIVPLFALVLTARAPRQAMRTTTLLSLTIAFALFAQVFLATQIQRATDISNYVIASDFVGFLPQTSPFSGTFEQQEAHYSRIPGVLSASLAYVNDENFQNAGTNASLTVIAADPNSFGSSIIWPRTINPTTLNTTLKHLADQRTTLKADLAQNLHNALPPLPALVSTAASKLLHLSVGARFFINTFNPDFTPLTFIDAGEVSYLPGVPHVVTDQGILVDYDSFKAAYNLTLVPSASLAPTTAWFHTRQDTASLTSVQHSLSSGPLRLTPLITHQSIHAALQDDPLVLNLLSVLGLGIGLTLLITWISCLASAWSYVRIRLRSLLVLRALGSTPAQLAQLLSYEQIILYATALILGIGCGIAFTALALPDMIFSSSLPISMITSVFSLNIFQLQSTPPLQIVIPPTVFIGLGVVLLLCMIGIGLTATMVMRLSPAQMLRLSEDYMDEAPLRSGKPDAPPIPSSNQKELSGQRQTLRHMLELGRALTPVRSSWSTLALTQLGVLISVLFVCVVPLFSQVAATAGLRDVLRLPANSSVVATNNLTDSIPLGHVRAALAQGTTTLNKTLFGQAGAYFHAAPIVTLNQVSMKSTKSVPTHSSSASRLTFASVSATALAGQIQLLQGQLPRQIAGTNGNLQILLTTQAASYLHVHVGDVLTKAEGYPLTMQLVGLFQPQNTTTLLPTAGSFFYNGTPNDLTTGTIMALTTTEGLVQAVDSSATQNATLIANVAWNYPIDETVTSLQLNNLITTLSSLNLQQGKILPGTFTLSTLQTPVNALQNYQQSVLVSTIPLLCTSVLIIALLLLFLNFMASLLVEREANVVALLRSRGATRYQIFAAFLRRALLINGIGFLAAMLLAIPTIIVLTHMTLLPEDQAGLFMLADHPLQTFWSLASFAAASTGVTLLAMGLTLFQATRTDYLSMRRETARETRKALWQRWYLDVVGIILALVAYGFSLYLTNAGILDPAVNVQIKSPLVLAATLCLVLACTLVLLRIFPLLLRLGTRIAMRNRGIESMLALSQMAHAPRQRLRTALLLVLTTAFVVFAVIFNASQTQHINDTAQYWATADFSGPLPQVVHSQQVGKVLKAYQHVKGITSVTLGDTETVQISNGTMQIPMQMQMAVDPKSFIHTAQWRGLDTPALQDWLLERLNHPNRFLDLSNAWQNSSDNAVPAVISTNSALNLGVKTGQTFTSGDSLGGITFFVVAEVDGMPDSTILVDYAMYSLIYQEQSTYTGTVQTTPINYIWIQTDGSSQSLQHVRQALEMGPLHLSTFYDRQATAQEMAQNPLNRNLVGILSLGTFAPLLLTWIGCLMASLVEIRQRQLLFGVLRALGSTPAQLMRVLSWEQALIFGASIILGTLFGLLTAFLALPSLVLTNVLPTLSIAGGGSLANGVQDLFSWQNTPAAYTVIPPLLSVVVAVLVALAFLAVILMTRSASSIALGQALRVNED